MKTLILKEFRLSMIPGIFLFAILSSLVAVPEYPTCVCTLYFIFMLQIVFQLNRVNKDIEFTAMCPVPRKHIVASKVFVVTFLQMVQLIVAVPFAIYAGITGVDKVSMEPNLAFFGVSLISFAVFQFFFLTTYFKKADGIGISYIFSGIGYVLVTIFFEVIAAIPEGNVLLGYDPANMVYQAIVFAIGLIIYVCGVFLTYKRSTKNFERVNI